jgi:hypothetical protein
MMAHAVLLLGESQVVKSSIITRVLHSSPLFPPFASHPQSLADD